MAKSSCSNGLGCLQLAGVSLVLLMISLFGAKPRSLNSYHMFQPPILREPPSIELPDPEDDMTFYGEVFIRYPESKWKVDVRHGHVFRAVSGFRAILNDVALDLSNGEGRPLSPARLHYHWQRIMVWYEGLPPCLAVERIALPCHLKVQ